MAKKKSNPKITAHPKAWREGELIETFQLNRITTYETPLLQEWLAVQLPEFNAGEQYYFDKILNAAQKNIAGWNEEDLKMNFISHVLYLGQMTITEDNLVLGYFDKTISATVENIHLIVKSDFMLAKGILDVFKTPYFHFQEYKPNKNPSGDSIAQLLEAFLIAQVKNKNGKPIYGVEVVGRDWSFMVMEGKQYCISNPLICTHKNDLLKIIAILRKFKAILYEKLID
jgi:hypothetical protein